MYRKHLISALLIVLSVSAFAETYTLEQCIDTALTNSLKMRTQNNTAETKRIAYNQQRQNLLPSLNGNVGQTFSFGRATGADNVTVSQNMANTSFGLSASLTLFDGLGMKYRIDEAKANMQAQQADLEKLQSDIRMNISGMYLQALLNKELFAVADSQLEATRLKVQQSERLVESGRLAEGDLYQLRAQYAKEELSRTQAYNTLRLSLLDLAQAMEIEYSSDFDIAAPLTDDSQALLPTNDDVYNYALQHRPEIRSAQLQLQAQESALKGAKSAYSPTLTAGANLGTGYYHRFGGTNDSFGTQLGNNLQTSVGLNLSIPIFDRMQTPNNVTKQKLSIENSRIQIEQTKKDLRKNIDQAYYNAVAAQTQQVSAQKAEQSAAEAYRYTEQKYEAGRASFYELNEAKNTFMKARSEYLQAKYNYLFKLKILYYYQGTL